MTLDEVIVMLEMAMEESACTAAHHRLSASLADGSDTIPKKAANNAVAKMASDHHNRLRTIRDHLFRTKSMVQ